MTLDAAEPDADLAGQLPGLPLPGPLRLPPEPEATQAARHHLESLQEQEIRDLAAATRQAQAGLPRNGPAWAELERGLCLLRNEVAQRGWRRRKKRLGLPFRGRPPDPVVTARRRLDAGLRELFIDWAAARQRILQAAAASEVEEVVAQLTTAPSQFGRLRPMGRQRKSQADDLTQLVMLMADLSRTATAR
jgi:hypothetical protein